MPATIVRVASSSMLVYGNERTDTWRAIYVMAKPEIIVKAVLKLMEQKRVTQAGID